MDFSIGELTRRTQVKVPTIRYYEQIGLLAPPPRTEGQQRRYDKKSIARLAFIRHARELGFNMEAIPRFSRCRTIRTIVAVLPTGSHQCASLKSRTALPASAPCEPNCSGC